MRQFPPKLVHGERRVGTVRSKVGTVRTSGCGYTRQARKMKKIIGPWERKRTETGGSAVDRLQIRKKKESDPEEEEDVNLIGKSCRILSNVETGNGRHEKERVRPRAVVIETMRTQKALKGKYLRSEKKPHKKR